MLELVSLAQSSYPPQVLLATMSSQALNALFPKYGMVVCVHHYVSSYELCVMRCAFLWILSWCAKTSEGGGNATNARACEHLMHSILPLNDA